MHFNCTLGALCQVSGTVYLSFSDYYAFLGARPTKLLARFLSFVTNVSDKIKEVVVKFNAILGAMNVETC